MDEMRDALKGEPEKGDENRRLAGEWLKHIKDAGLREQSWIDQAKEAEAIYLVDEKELPGGVSLPRVNILHGNVEIIAANLYNSTPNPDIRTRNEQDDPVARNVADILEAAIKAQIDDGRLDRAMEKAVQDAYVAGRGIIRLQFAADVASDEEGNPSDISGEQVIFRNVSWRDYREAPATRWTEVNWVAFRHIVSEQEHRRILKEGAATGTPEGITERDGRPNAKDDIVIWEVWDRVKRQVLLIDEHASRILKASPDPFGLRDFFPMPEPLQPVTGTGRRTPVCPYSVYKHLANELNLASERIYNIMTGLKVRGYVSSEMRLDAINLSQANDNELVILDGTDNVSGRGGMDKMIYMMPVGEASQVLERLYIQRDACTQKIYEVTGISDIIRGATSDAETATAQKLKSDWGSLRLSQMQRKVQSAVRGAFVICAEMVAVNFSHRTLTAISGVPVGEAEAAELGGGLDHHTIDVETDSTIMGNRREFLREFTELMAGTGAFVREMGPLGQSMPSAAAAFVQLYGAFAKRFRLGREGEQAILEIVRIAATGEDQKAAEAQAARDFELREREVAVKEQQAEQVALNREQASEDKGADRELKRDVEGGKLAIAAGELQNKADQVDIDAAAENRPPDRRQRQQDAGQGPSSTRQRRQGSVIANAAADEATRPAGPPPPRATSRGPRRPAKEKGPAKRRRPKGPPTAQTRRIVKNENRPHTHKRLRQRPEGGSRTGGRRKIPPL